jgi:hypothetical protein
MRTTTLLALLWFLLSTPAQLGAQANSADPSGIQLTRLDLQTLVTRFEDLAGSEAYSAELRGRARMEASFARERLRSGDFQTGDQIELTVEGEPALTGTFTVGGDGAVTLPEIGAVPLQGVLRAELQEHLASQLGRYLQNPVVRARGLFRVTVSGAVGRPGFYVVPAQSLLSDVITTAGGFGNGAALTGIRVERGRDRIWDGNSLQTAIIEGRTLDQLSLRAGDHIIVPAATAGGRNWVGTLQMLVVALPSLLFTIRMMDQVF